MSSTQLSLEGLLSTSEEKVQSFLDGLAPLDRHFATLLEKLSGGKNPDVALAGAVASYFTTREGYICVNLFDVAERKILPDLPQPHIPSPAAVDWISQLRRTNVVGMPGEFRPLILDEKGRLYLQRYWEYETQLVHQIKNRLVKSAVENERLRDGLGRLFPNEKKEPVDWQKVAAFAAVTRQFSVISGGPGTGKTTTVLKILALLAEQVFPDKLRIALAAPTGKAAARLQESIQAKKKDLNCLEEIKNILPETASTIHRLLGRKIDSPQFRHDADNPLPVDVVVVDEASMVDLALMSKLFQAVPPEAKIILLGDKDQLSSVEAGAVLGDICGGATNGFSDGFREDYGKTTGDKIPGKLSGQPAPVIYESIVELKTNHRFKADTAIGDLSNAVNAGEVTSVMALLEKGSLGVKGASLPTQNKTLPALKSFIVEYWEKYINAKSPGEALQSFNHFRILCAVRNGPHGVIEFNRLAELILREKKWISARDRWYVGRPIMITCNDYQLNLFNGDIGTIRRGEKAGEVYAYFAGENGEVRKFLPLRLPEHETVYAMTVHKSQGSEFENVLMVLPERDSPVVTRELIYTGITRAKMAVTLWSKKDVLEKAMARTAMRTSCLNERLRD